VVKLNTGRLSGRSGENWSKEKRSRTEKRKKVYTEVALKIREGKNVYHEVTVL